MSDARAQSIVVLCSSMMLAGAGLSGFGLFRALARYRDWRSACQGDDGDIVIGDGRLEVGQGLILAVGTRMLPGDPSGVAHGSIVEISRKHCVIVLEAPESGCSWIDAGPVPPQGSREARGDALRWPGNGAEITVSVTAATAIYRFTARVRDVRRASDGLRIIFSRPGILTRIQRRKHARVGLDVPATFERVRSPQAPSGRGEVRANGRSPILHGAVRDMSGGGLRAHIGGVLRLQEIDTLLRLFQPEATVRVGLPFPALPGSAVLARVRSSGRAVTVGGLTVQVALEFLPMPAWERELIVQHVFQLQREQLRGAKLRRHDSQPGLCQ